MTHSMTAFARLNRDTALGRFNLEMRSVNSRFLESTFRLPDSLRDAEPALRELLQKRISRGKVETSIRFAPATKASSAQINPDAVYQFLQMVDKVQAIIGPGQALNVMDVLQWPGVMNQEVEETDSKALSEQVLALYSELLDSYQTAREREGAALAALLTQRLSRMSDLTAQVQVLMPQALAAQHELLKARLADFLQHLEPNRLEAEMVLLAQKADVAEEIDRLNTHIHEVKRTLSLNEPIGRKLDFMMQELNREANTLSSKALTTGITQAAVELKVLIEQMREQVQNIE